MDRLLLRNLGSDRRKFRRHRRDARTIPRVHSKWLRHRTAAQDPPSLAHRSVSGLRTRGGFEVDLTWRDSRLVSATLRSVTGGTTQLRYAGKNYDLTLAPGGSFRWDGN